jgi:hypothetical protein
VFASGFEDDLVDVTMEGIIREVGQLVDSAEIVVFFGRPLSQSIVLGIFIGQNAGTAGMQPKSGVGGRMSFGQTDRNGSSRTFVIRSICSV